MEPCHVDVTKVGVLLEHIRQEFNLPLYEVSEISSRIFPDWRWKGLLQNVSEGVARERERGEG